LDFVKSTEKITSGLSEVPSQAPAFWRYGMRFDLDELGAWGDLGESLDSHGEVARVTSNNVFVNIPKNRQRILKIATGFLTEGLMVADHRPSEVGFPPARRGSATARQ
jgi:hypothetical protein